MAVALDMGVSGVSYQRAVETSAVDYPRARVNLPVGAAIPSHIAGVFRLDASERAFTEALRPRLANPYVTAPARYRELFEDIETATRDHAVNGPGADVVQRARTLLVAMKTDFAAFESRRAALIQV